MRLDSPRLGKAVKALLAVLAMIGVVHTGVHAAHVDPPFSCTLCGCNKLIFSELYHGTICDPGPIFPEYCTSTTFHWCDIFGDEAPVSLNIARMPSLRLT
jgi:hypothetical protein